MGSNLEEALVGQIESLSPPKDDFDLDLFLVLYLPAENTKNWYFFENHKEILKWRQEEKINEELHSNTTVYFANRNMWNYQWAIRFRRGDKRTRDPILYRYKTGRKSRLVYARVRVLKTDDIEDWGLILKSAFWVQIWPLLFDPTWQGRDKISTSWNKNRNKGLY